MKLSYDGRTCRESDKGEVTSRHVMISAGQVLLHPSEQDHTWKLVGSVGGQ